MYVQNQYTLPHLHAPQHSSYCGNVSTMKQGNWPYLLEVIIKLKDTNTTTAKQPVTTIILSTLTYSSLLMQVS